MVDMYQAINISVCVFVSMYGMKAVIIRGCQYLQVPLSLTVVCKKVDQAEK
jgi:hypothetical protein